MKQIKGGAGDKKKPTDEVSNTQPLRTVTILMRLKNENPANNSRRFFATDAKLVNVKKSQSTQSVKEDEENQCDDSLLISGMFKGTKRGRAHYRNKTKCDDLKKLQLKKEDGDGCSAEKIKVETENKK